MLKSSFCLFLIILNNTLNSVLRLMSSEYYFITAVSANYLNLTDKRGGVKQSLGAELKKYCISFPGKSSLHTPLLLHLFLIQFLLELSAAETDLCTELYK